MLDLCGLQGPAIQVASREAWNRLIEQMGALRAGRFLLARALEVAWAAGVKIGDAFEAGRWFERKVCVAEFGIELHHAQLVGKSRCCSGR